MSIRAFLFCLASMASVYTSNAQTLPAETDRLVATGKLWVTVRYFHPALAYRPNINWDQALVEALPKIRAAQTLSEYQSAVEAMLHVLDTAASASASPGHRQWIHHGFPPETGDAQATPFYSAFLNQSGDSAGEIHLPMGGFSVRLALSEPISAASAVPLEMPSHWDSSPYPATELRILAAYKIWGILHYFFAYRDLLDEDWDSLFPQFLPRLIAAKDALEYNLAIAEWLTHAADTLTAPQSAALSHYFGEAPVGLRLHIVEKQVVVTQVLDPEAGKSGIKVGDVVKRVDGETLVDRFKREQQYLPASTPQRLAADVVSLILNGAPDSTAALTLEDVSGNRKEVHLKRSTSFIPLLNALPAGETFKSLRAGVGYVDLRRLKVGDVPTLFQKFQDAPALIFDMRGVPVDLAAVRLVASRLVSEPDVASAIVTGPIVSFPDVPREGISGQSSSFFFLQTLPSPVQPRYKGRTVLLVDEQTIAQGEEAGLILEAANKTEFVGSPTAGAHSVLTNFTVPGGITISFSGEDIRHGNGGKLQRLGLQPNLSVSPTLSSIRTAKDEVLNKALDLVSPAPANAKSLPSRATNSHLDLPVRLRGIACILKRARKTTNLDYVVTSAVIV